jgi:hypothetical protein
MKTARGVSWLSLLLLHRRRDFDKCMSSRTISRTLSSKNLKAKSCKFFAEVKTIIENGNCESSLILNANHKAMNDVKSRANRIVSMSEIQTPEFVI